MPVISMFYGIVVLMYYFDNRQHHLPHVHVKVGDDEAVITIPEANFSKDFFQEVSSSWYRLG